MKRKKKLNLKRTKNTNFELGDRKGQTEKGERKVLTQKGERKVQTVKGERKRKIKKV